MLSRRLFLQVRVAAAFLGNFLCLDLSFPCLQLLDEAQLFLLERCALGRIDLAGSFVNVDIDISKVDAGLDARNRLLTGPDFFNAREYPTESFRSSSVKKVSDGVYEVTGTFTMHGVSKEITVPIVEYTTKRLAKFGNRAGFECTFEVDRSDYGMNMFIEEGTLSGTVRIITSIQGVQRPE